MNSTFHGLRCWRFALGRDLKSQGRKKAAIGRALAGAEPIEPYRPIIKTAARELGVSVDPATTAGRLFERTLLRGYALGTENRSDETVGEANTSLAIGNILRCEVDDLST